MQEEMPNASIAIAVEYETAFRENEIDEVHSHYQPRFARASMQDARYLRLAELCLQMAQTVSDGKVAEISGPQPRNIFPALPTPKARVLKTRPLKGQCHDGNHYCHQ
jgi:hypothetical protein